MVMLAIWMASCTPKDDALAIRDLVEKGARLAEAHEIGDLMDLTTEDFIASPGRHDVRGTKSILFMAFRHYGRFKIHFPRPSVALNKQSNEAEAVIYFAIVRDDQPLPGLKEFYDNPERWIQKAGELADLYKLELQITKPQKKWLIKSADLVVLDMVRPSGMDGLETYRRILAVHLGQKAIVASGYAPSERVKVMQDLGAGAHVRKPYTLENIGLAVRRELDRKAEEN